MADKSQRRDTSPCHCAEPVKFEMRFPAFRILETISGKMGANNGRVYRIIFLRGREITEKTNEIRWPDRRETKIAANSFLLPLGFIRPQREIRRRAGRIISTAINYYY